LVRDKMTAGPLEFLDVVGSFLDQECEGCRRSLAAVRVGLLGMDHVARVEFATKVLPAYSGIAEAYAEFTAFLRAVQDGALGTA